MPPFGADTSEKCDQSVVLNSSYGEQGSGGLAGSRGGLGDRDLHLEPGPVYTGGQSRFGIVGLQAEEAGGHGHGVRLHLSH